MSVREAAKHFGVSIGTIYRRIKKGLIKAKKKGRRWVVSIDKPEPDNANDLRQFELDLIDLYYKGATPSTKAKVSYFAMNRYPFVKCDLFGWYSELHVRAHFAKLPPAVHVAPNSTIAQNTVKMELEAEGFNEVLELSGFVEFGNVVTCVIRQDRQHPLLDYAYRNKPVRMRVRAMLNVRPVYADGGAAGEATDCEWYNWSDWFTVDLSGYAFGMDQRVLVTAPNGDLCYHMSDLEKRIGPLNWDKKFWDVVREQRQSMGITVNELALAINKDSQYVNDMENGFAAPSESLTGKLAGILHMQDDWLVALKERDVM